MPKTNVNGHSGAIAIYYVPRRNARVEKLRGTEQKSPLRCGKKKNRVSLSRICVRFNEDKAPSKKSPKCVFAILLACPPYSFVWIEKKKNNKRNKGCNLQSGCTENEVYLYRTDQTDFERGTSDYAAKWAYEEN